MSNKSNKSNKSKKVRTYGTQNGAFIIQNGIGYQFNGEKWKGSKDNLDFLGWYPAAVEAENEIETVREILMDNKY